MQPAGVCKNFSESSQLTALLQAREECKAVGKGGSQAAGGVRAWWEGDIGLSEPQDKVLLKTFAGMPNVQDCIWYHHHYPISHIEAQGLNCRYVPQVREGHHSMGLQSCHQGSRAANVGLRVERWCGLQGGPT